MKNFSLPTGLLNSVCSFIKQIRVVVSKYFYTILSLCCGAPPKNRNMKLPLATLLNVASFHLFKSMCIQVFFYIFHQEYFKLGMARGIPRPSFLEVPDLFSLLDSPRNRFYHSSDPRVLAKIPRGPRRPLNFLLLAVTDNLYM